MIDYGIDFLVAGKKDHWLYKYGSWNLKNTQQTDSYILKNLVNNTVIWQIIHINT